MDNLTTHKWGIKDKPELVAKKYKLKNFDLIWKDQANKKLAKARKKPENLKKGDVVTIPRSAKELKEIAARRTELLAHISNEARIHDALLAKARMYDEAEKTFAGYIKESNGFYGRMISQLKGDHKKIEKMKKGVDIAWEVSSMAISMGKIGSAYKKAGSNTTALAKVNKDATKLAADIAKKPMDYLVGEGKKAVTNWILNKGPDELKTAYEVRQVMVDSWDNIQSPSFWFLAAASKLDGKSWSESVTRDLAAEKKEQVGRITIQRREEIAKMEKIRVKCIKAAKECRNAAKAAAFRSKVAKKLLALVPET